MNNNKTSFILFLALISIVIFSACERDDICIDETTPHLIILFNDATNTSEKKSVNLTVEIEVSGTLTPIMNEVTTDSIAIPLRVDTNLTKFKFIKNIDNEDAIVDEFTLNYTTNEVFVSRSCGFKTTYHDLEISNVITNWIQNISIINSTIENETASHISIFH